MTLRKDNEGQNEGQEKVQEGQGTRPPKGVVVSLVRKDNLGQKPGTTHAPEGGYGNLPPLWADSWAEARKESLIVCQSLYLCLTSEVNWLSPI